MDEENLDKERELIKNLINEANCTSQLVGNLEVAKQTIINKAYLDD